TAQLHQTIGTPVVDSSRIYVIASIILEVIGVVIGLIVAGLLGLIAIAIAYGSGYLLLGNPLIGIALFVLSAIFLFLGHRNKNKKRLYDGKNGKI
ncbi:MAG: hypothetical protein KGH50_02970, partial [Candidatus Micrarchaeota archaeon]|nr:hypothetical protein [Candidatus Micrarchaeota archaeon]